MRRSEPSPLIYLRPVHEPVPDRGLSEKSHQTDLSTQEEVRAQDAWLSCAHVHPRRTTGPESAAPQGPPPPHACASAVSAAASLSGRRFSEVRAHGGTGRNGRVRAWSLSNDGDGVRLGYSVARAKNAVQRNRVRRRLRAAVSGMLAELRGSDVIISATPDAADVPFTALQSDVKFAVQRACGHA